MGVLHLFMTNRDHFPYGNPTADHAVSEDHLFQSLRWETVPGLLSCLFPAKICSHGKNSSDSSHLWTNTLFLYQIPFIFSCTKWPIPEADFPSCTLEKAQCSSLTSSSPPRADLAFIFGYPIILLVTSFPQCSTPLCQTGITQEVWSSRI